MIASRRFVLSPNARESANAPCTATSPPSGSCTTRSWVGWRTRDRALSARAANLPDAQRRALAGLLDVLRSPPTYERLIGVWNLDNAEAVTAVQWVIAKVIAAVDDNERPGTGA